MVGKGGEGAAMRGGWTTGGDLAVGRGWWWRHAVAGREGVRGARWRGGEESWGRRGGRRRVWRPMVVEEGVHAADLDGEQGSRRQRPGGSLEQDVMLHR